MLIYSLSHIISHHLCIFTIFIIFLTVFFRQIFSQCCLQTRLGPSSPTTPSSKPLSQTSPFQILPSPPCGTPMLLYPFSEEKIRVNQLKYLLRLIRYIFQRTPAVYKLYQQFMRIQGFNKAFLLLVGMFNIFFLTFFLFLLLS